MMGYDDKPTERFRPKLVRYQGKIYPANQIFDETGQPVAEPQYGRLGLDGNLVTLTAYSQAYVKPGLYLLMLISSCALVALVGGFAVHWVFGKRRAPLAVRRIPLIVAGAAVVGVVFLFGQPELMDYMLPTPMWLDANHFLVAVGVMLVGLIALLWELRQWISDHGQFRSTLGIMTALVLTLSLAAAAGAGVLVFLKIPALDAVTRASYTVFDAGLTVLLVAVIVTVLRGVTEQLRGNPVPAQTESRGGQ